MEHNSPKECQSVPCPAPGWDSLQNGRTAAAILWLIIAGGVALRIYGLFGRSMWFDESASWRMIQFPLGEMIERTARDNHVPLFFLLLRLWIALVGESLIALRTFSVAFSALAMLGVYLFTIEAMRLAGKDSQPQRLSRPVIWDERNGNAHSQFRDSYRAEWIALVATALFAVNLYQVCVADEIRMYSLGTALSLLSSWLLVRALRARPAHGLPWMLYMLVGLLFAYTNYCALFSLFAQALFSLGYLLYGVHRDAMAAFKDVRLRWFAVAYAGIATGWSPWLPMFCAQSRRAAENWNIGSFSVRNIPHMLFEMYFHWQVHGWLMTYETLIAGACCIVAILALWRNGAGVWCAGCLAVVPFALISLVSLLRVNLMMPRYMAFWQPFLLILMAVAIWRIPIGWLRDLIALLVISGGLLLQVDFVDSLDLENRPGARAAAAYIDSQRRPGEPVIASSPLVMLPTLYHSGQREGWYVYSGRWAIPYYAGGSILTNKEILLDEQMSALRTKHAWVVTSSGGWAGWHLFIPSPWIQTSERRFREVYSFQDDVKVLCYEIPEGN